MRPATTRPITIRPIEIPTDWTDDGLLGLKEFSELIRTSERTVRDWRRRNLGPTLTHLEGCGRLYTTVRETRRFLRTAVPHTSRADQATPISPTTTQR